MFNNIRSLSIAVELRDKVTNNLRRVDNRVNTTQGRLTGLRNTVQQNAGAIMGLGAAMTGVGVGGLAAVTAGTMDFERAQKELFATTNATAEEQENMTRILKELGRTNSDNFNTISTVVAKAAARYDVFDDRLKTVSQSVLDFSKVTGLNATQSVQSLSIAANAFNIPASEMYRVTDTLIGAQREFGTDVKSITPMLERYSSVLSQLGLNFSETVSLLSAMEDQGANVSRVMMGMRQIISKGLNMQEVIRELQGMEDQSKMTARAVELAGAYAGPALAKMIKQGIDPLEDYSLTMDKVAGKTREASEEIDKSLSETMGILKNNVKLLVAEVGMVLLPALKRITDGIKYLSDRFQALPGPLKNVIAVLGGLTLATMAVTGPVLMFTAALAMSGGLGGAVTRLIGPLKILSTVLMTRVLPSILAVEAPLLPIIGVLAGITAAVLLLQHAWTHNWGDIQGKTEAVINAIRGAIDWLINGIKTLIDWITAIPEKISEAWKAVTDNPAFKAIKGLLESTPLGMGVKTGSTLITEGRLPNSRELLPTAVTSSTNNVNNDNRTNIERVEVKTDDPKKFFRELDKELAFQNKVAPG